MFGVIICPKCHRARGASLSSKKVKCPHCGKSIDVSLAKVYHRTESQEELALAVQRLTERMSTNIEDYPAERKRRARASAPKAPRLPTSEMELADLARKLTAEKGGFSPQDLMSATGASEEESAQMLKRMTSSAMVFEPSPGRFRAL